MLDTNNKKEEFYLSVKEAAEKLRILADELESGVITINQQKFSIAPDFQVKISQKTKGHILSFKLKFKLANSLTETVDAEGGSTSSSEPDDENYKDLKKRMAKDFKAIKKSCMQGQVLPEPGLMERFCQDSKIMCSYPNKGEEFYETFLRQAGLLNEAFKASDLNALGAAVTALGQIRSDCHEKYK